jgi:hypothetical protein
MVHPMSTEKYFSEFSGPRWVRRQLAWEARLEELRRPMIETRFPTSGRSERID